MPGVVRLGDACSGHGCWPPRPNITASVDVFTNGIGTHRLGDAWAVHCCEECHPGITIAGSSSVFVNGVAVARLGDAVDCGSVCMVCSIDVFAGG